MYHQPPTTVTSNAADGLNLARTHHHTLPPAVHTTAQLLAAGQPVNTQTLARLLDQNLPNPYPETCDGPCPETINFIALGGIHATAWCAPHRAPIIDLALPPTGTYTAPAANPDSLAGDGPTREPVAAGLPQLGETWARLYAETIAQLEGFTEAAFASMLRRAGAKAVNKARAADAAAATAAMELPYHRRPQALAAALTVTEEDLLRDALEEHIDQLEPLIERRQRQFARALADELGVSFQAVWDEIREQLEEDRSLAVVLWAKRLTTYAFNVLRLPDARLTELELSEAALRPPTSIAADTLDVSGGAATTTDTTTRRQATDLSTGDGAPVVERNTDTPETVARRTGAPDAPSPGPTFYEQLAARTTRLEVDYVWSHNTPEARAYKPHEDLDGVRISTETDDVREINDGLFDNPDFDGQRPNNHPDGPDHKGCRCFINTEVDGELAEDEEAA